MTSPDFDAYLDLDEDELHAALGATLLGHGPGFSATDDERFRRHGDRWFSSHMRDIRDKVCPNSSIATGNTPSEAAAVLDAVAGMAGHPVPTIVAALVVKYGIKRLCRDWAPAPET